MRTSSLAAVFALFATVASAEGEAPVPVPPDVSARVYVRETGDYEPMNALGKIGAFDAKTRVVTDYLDVAHIACRNSAFEQIKPRQLVGKQAYGFTLDRKYEGSISIFVANAQLKDSERMRVTVTDAATVELTGNAR